MITFNEFQIEVLNAIEKHQNIDVFLAILNKRLTIETAANALNKIIARGYKLNVPPEDVADIILTTLVDVEISYGCR